MSIKLLFSFREDYLAKFSKLFRAIPDLRDHSLRVKAIDKDDIEKIISCPFDNDNNSAFYNQPLSKVEIALLTTKLLDFFKERDADLTDIQIVCQYVFETKAEDRESLFSLNGVEKEDSIGKIIQMFYEKQLETFLASDKAIATSILSLLVLNEHTRNLFHSEAIVEELKDEYDSDQVIKVLLDLDNRTRLIRSEARPGGTYYEINSESLIPYINKLKIKKEQEEIQAEQEKERKEKEKKAATARKNKIYIFGAISIIIVLTIWYLVSMRRERANNTQSKYVYASGANEYSNPTLSYIIAKKGALIRSSNAKLDSITKNFSQSKNYYITAKFSYPHDIITAFFEGNRIVVVQKSGIDYLDKNGLIVDQRPIPRIIYADHHLGYLITVKNSYKKNARSIEPTISSFFPERWINGDLDVTIYQNELRKFDGTVLGEFTTWSTPYRIAIAPDGKVLTIDDYIYKVGEQLPYARINESGNFKDLMAIKFTKDSKHILAGFWSGHVTVNDLNGKWAKIFSAGSFNSVVTCLAACNNLKYLVVGGRENNLRFFELGNINLPGRDNVGADDIITKSKTIYLEKESATGQINDVVLSPADNSFLSVTDDKSGSIWSFDGKKVGMLNGHKEKISSGDFSKDGKQILTWTPSGNIYIWKRDNIDLAYANNTLATFSPFDYRNSNLYDFSAKDIYPNINDPKKGLSVALNYLSSLPDHNYHPDDKEYQKISKISLTELSDIFGELLKPGNAVKLNSPNRKLLYYSYAKFRTDSLNLIAGTAHEDSAYYTRYVDNLKWQTSALMVDTADKASALADGITYSTIAQLLADSAFDHKYKKAIQTLNYEITLLKAFREKYPTDENLIAELGSAYGNMAWYALFTKDYQTVLTSAKKGLNLGAQFDWINTNLALGYLLSGKFDEANKIYNSLKDKTYNNGRNTFRNAFLGDFANLTKAGAIDMKNNKLATEIRQISIMLNSK